MPFATQRAGGVGAPARLATQLRTGRPRGPGEAKKGLSVLGFVSAFGASTRSKGAVARLLVAPVLLGLGAGLTPSATESAIANGDTRTLSFTDGHTNEAGTFTYMVDGVYDQPTLDKLNWFMRDWRLNKSIKMDPKLFDIVWEVYRESGSKQPIDVLSGYRSPQTNALLRRRSSQVAKYSQHMEGKAIDAHFIDVDTPTIRDIAMRMQAGGVGFYPSSHTPWVHIDSGDVRYWPRMSHDALARIFPDGKTVFIPADGQPMAGFDQAKAEIEARGGEVVTAQAGNSPNVGLFSWLFGARGGGADDAEEAGGDEAAPVVRNGRAGSAAPQLASAAASDAVTTAQPTPVATLAPATDASDADAGPATTDAAAALLLAPMPPLKPIEIALADAPTPPMRPAEFAFASPQAANAGDRDLIAALLARGGLPRVITRGMGPPRGVMALSEVDAPEPPGRPALLARAAALAAPLPPLPRPRPAAISNEVTGAIAARPTAGALALNAAPANPYGDLVTDGFSVDAAPTLLRSAATP